jgi:lysophospholipase L1-like esterase
MPRKLIVPLVAACALGCLLPNAAAATVKPSYYLALGDSLAAGVQPDAAGKSLPTKQGYANDLYAAEKKKIKGLKLEDLGCPGETTTTMMNGGICHYPAGSQLKQAVKFIRKHKHQIAFITLDIGANDVDNCLTGGTSINVACVEAGVATIQANVPRIAQALRKAAGRKVKIAGMTYYDPFLAEWRTGPTGPGVASLSVALAKDVNGDLASDYQAQHFKVSDVARAFDTYVPFTTTSTYAGQTVPLAVARVCELTWMCAPAPRGPNVHANATGYGKIETVFKKALG